MAQLIDSLRSINPRVKIAYHYRWCVYPIITKLIEIGVDVLNPIQPMADGSSQKLKNDYVIGCVSGIHDIQRDDPIRRTG